MAERVLMVDLTAPFLANDQGDVSISESLEDMVAQFEPTDALDGVHEFFDAHGSMLDPIPTEDRWRPMASVGEPQPERLERVLRAHFARLPNVLADFSARAERVSTLHELVQLKRELARTRRPGLRGKVFRQRWT
jgi:hypothetical protein